MDTIESFGHNTTEFTRLVTREKGVEEIIFFKSPQINIYNLKK